MRLRNLSLRAEALVDQHGFFLLDPTDRSVVGQSPIPAGSKICYALATNAQSGITRRYAPSHDPGDQCLYGIDFSAVIPVGLGIRSGALAIKQNVVPPQDASADWTIGTVEVRDRQLYANLKGGQPATDYALEWTVTDTSNTTWVRTALLLCSRTS